MSAARDPRSTRGPRRPDYRTPVDSPAFLHRNASATWRTAPCCPKRKRQRFGRATAVAGEDPKPRAVRTDAADAEPGRVVQAVLVDDRLLSPAFGRRPCGTSAGSAPNKYCVGNLARCSTAEGATVDHSRERSTTLGPELVAPAQEARLSWTLRRPLRRQCPTPDRVS